MKVLVPQLFHSKTSQVWKDNAQKIWESLTFKNKERAILDSDEDAGNSNSQYARIAKARNRVIDDNLKDDHTHVFWMDVDVVKYPKNIIEQLAHFKAEGTIAPYVFIEDNKMWPFKRFYDITAFIRMDGREFDWQTPFCEDDPYMLVEDKIANRVLCVGTCFLMDANIYRKGCRYDPMDGRTEHLGLFEQGAKLGYKVFATPDVEVSHAFLPKYGEGFH
jgi:hypothetical protein